MFNLKVDATGISKAKLFVAEMKNQLPFATSVALNQTARQVQLSLRDKAPQAFSNPVPYTLSAFRYNKSTKASLVAEVYADPSRKYFPTEVFGGQRRVKKYEAFLRGLSNGALPSGGKLLPTNTIRNAAGNPKKSVFSLIQSRLSTTDQGGFFIGTPKGGDREAGVYRRSRGKLHAYFVHIDEPNYQPRFLMEQYGSDVVRRTFADNFNDAIDRALASSKR